MTSYLLSRLLVPRFSSSIFCPAKRLHRSTYATIAGIYFPTQKALSDKLKSFVKDKSTILEPQNQKLAVEAVASYDKVYSRGEVKRVYVKPNDIKGKFGGLCMHVEISGTGEVITVSYAKVARAIRSPDKVARVRQRDRKIEALRRAVGPDILEFKNAKLSETGGVTFCEECGELIDRWNCQVDHHGQYEFRHIVKIYQDEEAGGDIFAIDEDDFQVYHQEMMELRLTCASCNYKKPKGW